MVVMQTPDREYLVRASYMEIYNENIVDLLGDARKQLNLGETLVCEWMQTWFMNMYEYEIWHLMW